MASSIDARTAAQAACAPLAEVSDAIGDAVEQYLKGGHASDDVTLILMQRL